MSRGICHKTGGIAFDCVGGKKGERVKNILRPRSRRPGLNLEVHHVGLGQVSRNPRMNRTHPVTLISFKVVDQWDEDVYPPVALKMVGDDDAVKGHSVEFITFKLGNFPSGGLTC